MTDRKYKAAASEEYQEYSLTEQQIGNSLMNELLDLQFPPSVRRKWLDDHPDDKELREGEADAPEE